MKQIRKRLTYANVMSSLAVFLVLGGATAFAALGKNTVGTKQLKKNAVTAAKIKKNSVTAAKIKKEAVNGAKIKTEAVNGAKIGKEAVTSDKLALSSVGADQLNADERSEVVSTSASSSFDFVDTYNPATWTTVLSAELPNGAWVVRAHIGIAIGGSKTHIGCRLLQGEEVLSTSGTEGEVLGIIPSYDGIDLQGIAGAGQVTVTCGDNNNGTTAVSRSLVATRAGSVKAG